MAATPPAEPAATAPPPPNPSTALPDQPTLSTADDGQSQRPRDARVLHLILSSLGIHSYQERVPLQLLDFAYRYTSSILSDSLRLSAEGYTSTGPTGKRGGGGGGGGAGDSDGSNITVAALRQAIASRMDNSFVTALPKEWMLEQAAERNRVMLPRIEKGFGMQLPPERYVLTGTPWGLKEEWDSDGEEGNEEVKAEEKEVNGVKGDETMGGMEDEEGEGDFEDVFGTDEGMKDA
ncbi:TFIID-31kDa-domain-containing protein [Myriangium duriaei CBS 260.36]|uniref:TFIID-31kDa-domain-containing protein n=1 Tax=Myriangium duriaei CBS 260.36 TaxID=1168546 RepID=A0A9P4MF37_9PEZI|nr:TFIID-31kDa-domain-containing protein [Myriangium duriaei CBS 260.36]